MALVFTASTTRTLLSAVAPFAPLPGGYITFPVVGPRAPVAALPPLAAVPEYEEIELHALGSRRAWSEVGVRLDADDSATPIMLGAAATGFAPRPRAPSALRSRTRSLAARLARGSAEAQMPAVAEEGRALLDGVKAARTAFASRTRRAFHSVFGPGGGPSRGDYVRLRGRD